MWYIDKMKCIAQKLPKIMDDELLDQFFRGLHPSIKQEVIKKDPNTFSKACYFAEICWHQDALTYNMQHSQ